MSNADDTFKYPEILYCPKCGRDVHPALQDREQTCQALGVEPQTIHFKAAVCPFCAEILCERDFDRAMLAFAMAHLRGRSNTNETEVKHDRAM